LSHAEQWINKTKSSVQMSQEEHKKLQDFAARKQELFQKFQ